MSNGEMLQVRVNRGNGWTNAWRRQVESKDSSYESSKAGIWQDRVTRRDRNPVMFLVSQLRKGGSNCDGSRVNQTDPVLIARAMLARHARQDKSFGALWSGMTPAQANELVEALATAARSE